MQNLAPFFCLQKISSVCARSRVICFQLRPGYLYIYMERRVSHAAFRCQSRVDRTIKRHIIMRFSLWLTAYKMIHWGVDFCIYSLSRGGNLLTLLSCHSQFVGDFLFISLYLPILPPGQPEMITLIVITTNSVIMLHNVTRPERSFFILLVTFYLF
jgi:hypothetical protein